MTHVPELWQGYTEQAEPDMRAGLTVPQSAAGALHGSVHIWFWRRNQHGELELLCQRRSDTMATWPGYISVSAAGHQDFGEAVLTTAIRETHEELGVQLDDDELDLLFTYRHKSQPTKDIIENEIQWIYGVNAEHPKLRYADGEVSGSRWYNLEQIKAMLGGRSDRKMVPLGDDYFSKLFAALAKFE
jgi:isopentenyldiphosphate isomerase